MSKSFLTAEWQNLAIANYAVDQKILEPFLPFKTEIDLWQGRCYVSLVAFRYVNTHLKGIRLPFHANFEEINLRFYIRSREHGESKHGLAFIGEIVPRRMVALVANLVYREHYEVMRTRYACKMSTSDLTVDYAWKKKSKWNSFRIITDTVPHETVPGSEEEFSTEHYWGYSKVSNEKTTEYQVEHSRWKVYKTLDYSVDVDFGATFGEEFGFLSMAKPASVFLAEGSEIVVKPRKIITA
jgi:uncharacterized protein YqjF (DUF2071 family)